jgi:uncharacterized RDD family membrane protein YckC
MLDTLLLLVPVVCAAIPLGVLEARASSGEDDTAMILFMVVAGLMGVALLGAQCFMIANRGQSIGKRLVKTRIVRLDGSNPGFVHGVLLRGLVGNLPGAVPFVGNVYNIVDTLCIFKDDRRTLRDMIAGTRVIQVHLADRAS